jgi:hypothetical protein
MTSENSNEIGENFQTPSSDDPKLMIDKTDVINALQKIIDDYPSETVPRSLVRKMLIKIAGSSDFSDLGDHPSLKKLDDLINKAKSV